MSPYGRRMFLWTGAGVALVAAAAALAWAMALRRPAVDVPVLMYHRIADDPRDLWSVSPRDFESQLAFLKTNGFHSILPRDLVPALGHAGRLPARPVVLTFDDGDLTTLTAAEPLLRQYGFRATAYLITGSVAPTPDGRRSQEGHPCLTWSEVREMRSRGTFDFGGHSRNHVRLNQHSDLSTEVAGCLKDLRDNAGFTPDSFCYPFGVYDRNVARAVRRAGFLTAVTAKERTARLGWTFDALTIPRLWVRGGRHTFAVRPLKPTPAGDRAFEIAHDGIRIPVTGRLLPDDAWRPPEELPPGKRIWTFSSMPASVPAADAALEIWDRNRFFRLYPATEAAKPVPLAGASAQRPGRARPLGALAVVAGLMALYGLVRPASVTRLSARLDASLESRRWVPPLILGAAALALLLVELWKHYAFATSAFDLRLHEELVRNAWVRDGFMWSNLLGHSFLAHHVSLIFPLLAPVYWVWPNCVWLLLVQGALVAAAAWFLWALARRLGLRPMVAASLPLVLLGSKTFVEGYMQGFHQELLALCFLFGFLWAEGAGRWKTAAAFALAAISCREDVAAPLLVYGIFVALKRPAAGTRRSAALGALLVVVCAAWLWVSYGWIMPHYAANGRLAAMERWSESGGYGAIAADILGHPGRLLRNLLNPGVLGLFGSLLFLPLGSARAALPLVIPLLVLTGSSFPTQARLGGAYALYLLPYIYLGVALTLARPFWRRLLADGRAAWVLCCALVALSWHDPRYPARTPGLADAHRGLAETNRTIGPQRVLAQGCILPHLAWSAAGDMLGSPVAGKPQSYDVILIAPDLDPWPLTRDEIVAVETSLAADGRWRRDAFGPVIRYVKSSNL